jgi:hypothetical protein
VRRGKYGRRRAGKHDVGAGRRVQDHEIAAVETAGDRQCRLANSKFQADTGDIGLGSHADAIKQDLVAKRKAVDHRPGGQAGKVAFDRPMRTRFKDNRAAGVELFADAGQGGRNAARQRQSENVDRADEAGARIDDQRAAPHGVTLLAAVATAFDGAAVNNETGGENAVAAGAPTGAGTPDDQPGIHHRAVGANARGAIDGLTIA